MYRKFIVVPIFILLFYTNMSAYNTAKVSANTWTAQFEEWASATYAGVVTGTMAVATGAMHAEQYLIDKADSIYQTAKDSWAKMAPDMKANFLSSVEQMENGIITVGDWITGALDALKAKHGNSSVGGSYYVYDSPDYMLTQDMVNKGYRFKVTYLSSTYQKLAFKVVSTGNGAELTLAWSIGGEFAWGEFPTKKFDSSEQMRDFTIKFMEDMWSGDIGRMMGAISTFGVSITTVNIKDGSVIDTDNTYSRLDDWIRERAIPNGQLGVYNPGAQAYTPDGYRLGLSTDRQTLLKLPDGIPWEGTADWKQPLLNTVDGTTAVLDTSVGSWINVATGAKIRDATAAEIARALKVSTAIAEGILSRAKVEEKAREKEKGQENGKEQGKIKDKSRNWGALITKKFPFSLPWDFMAMMGLLYAEPKTPKWEVTGTDKIPLNFTIDLKFLDPYIAWFRSFVLAGFVMAVIFMHRKFMGGAK